MFYLNPLQNTWEAYMKLWAQRDRVKRLKQFEQCLNPTCTYTDPMAQISGYEFLCSYISEFQENVPGGIFITTDFTHHHARSLAHWDMLDSRGKCLSQGASFALYGTDGRVMQMTDFFDPILKAA